MEEALKKLLESEVLDESTKTSIREAWESKLQEAEKQIETRLREEYAQRFEHDKAQLVESLDKFVTEHVGKEIEEFAADKNSLVQERAKLTRAIVESRKQYKAKLAERVAMLDQFVKDSLVKEVTEFRNDKKSLMEARKQMAQDLRSHKAKLDEQTKARIKKLDEFVLKQVSSEIEEFASDKKLLAETRAKLISESKQKLNETKAAFIKRAASLVEATVNQTLTKELSQLKEELRVVRENNFGRKIFEAFGAEFMNSYLAEGTKVKAVTRQVGELKAKLAEAEKKAADAKALFEGATRKIRSAEEQAQRSRIMSELLAPLGRDKRSVMEQMLQGVKTEKLREHYSRYLPAVVGDSAPKRAALNEGSARQVVTGDRNNKLAEAVKEEDTTTQDQLGEIIQLRKLAGIQ
jgi:hypothetical protein